MEQHGVIWHLPLLFLLKNQVDHILYIINLRSPYELSDEFGDDKIIADIELLFDRFHKFVILLQGLPAVFKR